MRQFKDDDVRVSLKLSHPNLLPFFGLYVLDNRPSLISPWMDNGDLKNFLNNAPSDINCIALITDVAMGLEYLHRNNVVHGDLKTANILVTPSGRACIADFGLASIVDELTLKMTFSSRGGMAGTSLSKLPMGLALQNHKLSSQSTFGPLSPIVGARKPMSDPRRLSLSNVSGSRLGKQQTNLHPTGTIHIPAKFRRSIQEWPLLPSIAEIERRIPSNTAGIDNTVSIALETVGDTEDPFRGHTQADQPNVTANVTAVCHEELTGNDRVAVGMSLEPLRKAKLHRWRSYPPHYTGRS
ncbi:kinase-like domain-containing protein [Mycena olivaceomarginata]|nr:kinase-like domain-containing protein [Mycena olivaceomarginata]